MPTGLLQLRAVTSGAYSGSSAAGMQDERADELACRPLIGGELKLDGPTVL